MGALELSDVLFAIGKRPRTRCGRECQQRNRGAAGIGQLGPLVYALHVVQDDRSGRGLAASRAVSALPEIIEG